MKHKEVQKIYANREWMLDSENYLTLFDLHLILYRSIKSETETKIDFQIKLSQLQELGLLKHHKYPFFTFKDNRNKSIVKLEKELIESILDNGKFYCLYKDYLPRSNVFHILKSFPDLEEYYTLNKKGVNKLNRFGMDPLISENENLDWFIYDDESLNFLIDMDKNEFPINETVKYDLLNKNKLYFQDKYPYILLPNKDYPMFYISLSLKNSLEDILTAKVPSSLTSTGSDLIKKINEKLKKIRPESCFDVKSKILKVVSLKYDYFNIQ